MKLQSFSKVIPLAPSYIFCPLHSNIQVKIGMMVCASNYAIHDGLFNGVDGVFQYVSKSHDSESLIWIVFNNPKVGFTTKIQNQHLYTNNILKHWTPIQPISKEIQVGDNSSQVTTCTQYPIYNQL
jgi:hypothetical protein